MDFEHAGTWDVEKLVRGRPSRLVLWGAYPRHRRCIRDLIFARVGHCVVFLLCQWECDGP